MFREPQKLYGCFSKPDVVQQVIDRFPFRLSPYLADLIAGPDDPVGRQFIPSAEELHNADGLEDPLAEEALSPVKHLVHRYPNRVLWLVGHECAALCRFCTRKRRWRSAEVLTDEDLRAGLDYLKHRREVRDVLLSGGDPLMLSNTRLQTILASLRALNHIEVIRIGSRVPGVMPERVTPELVGMLKRYHPIFMNLHFNHPNEITPAVRAACGLLADGGIPLGSQTVLLRGVNDEAPVLGSLFHKLLSIRVRPYYLMQMDLTAGTAHFRTPLSVGLRVLLELRNRISGLAVPQFVVDLPGGHGKVPLLPNTIESIHRDRVVFTTYTGARCEYPLLNNEFEDLRALRGA